MGGEDIFGVNMQRKQEKRRKKQKASQWEQFRQQNCEAKGDLNVIRKETNKKRIDHEI